MNISTTFVWIAYFFALQMIEPAVVFTIFSGLIPVAILAAVWFGVSEASPLRNRAEGSGLHVVVLASAYICAITMLGRSGFLRGDWTIAVVVVIGFAIMAFLVFAMQKAISLMSTPTLAAITALGPVFVFLFQIVEGRVDYAPASMTRLTIYFAGAILAAYGGARRPDRKAAQV
ncbi:hypothetical protein [uncultured Tateyamaria sp.]|uniref:hypothetical protein n=1 Tax=uncultured Tateyamaria sp. TaxID=455651 RepID=UPI00261416D4|nr:hypothetical protein [uncultured Tateyamaria sp.]